MFCFGGLMCKLYLMEFTMHKITSYKLSTQKWNFNWCFSQNHWKIENSSDVNSSYEVVNAT